MPKVEVITACVIVIGNEVLSGRTRDANLPFLAVRLNDLGIRLQEARVIADEPTAIVAAVNACRSVYDYIFTTGGIGPTHDDVTSAAVAEAFGVALWQDPQALAWLHQQYADSELNEARLRMANVPRGARLIENPVSRAPGFQMDNVFVLPGVPGIMQAMFDGIAPRLRGGQPLHSRTISAYVMEGTIAGPLAGVQERHPDVAIGSYPFVRGGRIGASLVMRSTDEATLAAAAADLVVVIRQAGAEPVEDPV
ncbi:MAG: competence/damage-inducible protein A [Rhodospirillales bacterium]|nr:competence/damage-inducible protein A [Rhodospirillales bacterium]